MDGTQQGSTAGCSEDDLLGTLLASLECGDSQQPPVVSSASPSVSSSTTSSTFVPGESQAKAAATSSTPPCADLRATATSHNCGADAVAPCAPHNNQQQQQQQQQDTQVQVPQQQQQQRQQGGDEDLSNSIQPIPLKLQGDFQPGELPSLPRLSAPTFGLAPSIEPQMCEGGGRLSGENLISDVLEYIRACSLSVIEYPFSQMKDGSCVLKGGSSTYKFSVLVQPFLFMGCCLITTCKPEPGAASPPVEKFENDLIRGGDPVPVNEEGVAVFPRICILSAGRGAVWKLRFYLNYKDQLLLTTDFPVRTFSKQKKIDSVLACTPVSHRHNPTHKMNRKPSYNPNEPQPCQCHLHSNCHNSQHSCFSQNTHTLTQHGHHSPEYVVLPTGGIPPPFTPTKQAATPTFLPATFQPVDQLPSSNPSGFFPVANTPTTTMMAPPSVQQQNQTFSFVSSPFFGQQQNELGLSSTQFQPVLPLSFDTDLFPQYLAETPSTYFLSTQPTLNMNEQPQGLKSIQAPSDTIFQPYQSDFTQHSHYQASPQIPCNNNPPLSQAFHGSPAAPIPQQQSHIHPLSPQETARQDLHGPQQQVLPDQAQKVQAPLSSVVPQSEVKTGSPTTQTKFLPVVSQHTSSPHQQIQQSSNSPHMTFATENTRQELLESSSPQNNTPPCSFTFVSPGLNLFGQNPKMARLSMFNPENTLHFGHWSSQREQELVELFEQTCGTVKRKLSPADLHSLRQIEETGEFSDLLLWLTRTASQIKKIPFVWDSKDPQLVSGFTSRDNANEMLSCSPVGTFLLRFSWADPGELVVAFVSPMHTIEQCYLLDERDPMSDIKVTEKVLQSSWLHRLQDTQTAPAPLQQNPSTPTPAPTPTTKDTTDHTDNNSIGEFSPESIPSTPSTTTTPIFQLAPLPPQQYRLTDKTVAFRHIRRLTHHRKPLKDDTE